MSLHLTSMNDFKLQTVGKQILHSVSVGRSREASKQNDKKMPQAPTRLWTKNIPPQKRKGFAGKKVKRRNVNYKLFNWSCIVCEF